MRAARGSSQAIASSADDEQRRSPGYRNSQRGLNSSRKRRCRQPSRQLRRCGGRERPSGDSVVGTSVMRSPRIVAFTTISLANSMPGACRSSARIAVALEAAQAAMEIAARAAEEDAADGGQHRVAEIAVQRRHRAGLDAAVETVAHHQVVAVAQLLDEAVELR